MFVRARNGRLYKLDAFEEVTENYSEGYAVGYLRGEGITIDIGAWQQALANWPCHLVAASGSDFVLMECETDDGLEFIQEPIVAWAFAADGGFRPVTFEGLEGDSRPILHQSGMVQIPFAETYASLDDFLSAKGAKRFG